MTQSLEEIRQNLLAAAYYQRTIYPVAPAPLQRELAAAWQRFHQLVDLTDQQQPRPGKSDQLGFIVIASLVVAGLATVFGGSWLVGRELNESKRLALLNKCIAEATQQGMSLAQAQKECNKVYQGKGLIDIDLGPGGFNTTLLLLGGVTVAGIILAGKYL